MYDQHRLLYLLDRHADVLLTEAELAELEDMLRASPRAREEFWAHAKWNAALRTWGEQEWGNKPADGPMRKVVRPRWFTARSLTAAAAVLALMGAGWALWNSWPREEGGEIAAVTTAVRHVAVITGMDAAVWDGAPYVLGQALPPVRLALRSGSAEISFGSGARVLLRGPAEFVVHSPSRGELARGDLSARVPQGAEGFVIDTPSVEVVDLGTEFGVKVGGDGVADVRVFKGVVETRAEASLQEPFTRLEANMARRFLPDGPAAHDSPAMAEHFPPLEAEDPQRPRTGGAIHILRTPPVSLKGLESDDFMLLYRETVNTEVPPGLQADIVKPGLYASRGDLRPVALPDGQRVDSWLLHFDAFPRPGTDARGAPLRLDGTVTFPRPVIGILCRGGSLDATDTSVGGGITKYKYAGDEWRGLEFVDSDKITLHPDRSTLSLSLRVHATHGQDQVRVLVEAE